MGHLSFGNYSQIADFVARIDPKNISEYFALVNTGHETITISSLHNVNNQLGPFCIHFIQAYLYYIIDVRGQYEQKKVIQLDHTSIRMADRTKS